MSVKMQQLAGALACWLPLLLRLLPGPLPFVSLHITNCR